MKRMQTVFFFLALAVSLSSCFASKKKCDCPKYGKLETASPQRVG